MKTRRFILLILILQSTLWQGCILAQKKQSRTFTVKGEVTKTSSYCGGARPTDEMLQEYAKPKPYQGKVFYIRKGDKNDLKKKPALQFTTDRDGKFTIKLPAGIYSLIQAEQLKPMDTSMYKSTDYISVDENCLRDWWSKPFKILKVGENGTDSLKFNFHQQCFIEGDVPCRSYTGPMPP